MSQPDGPNWSLLPSELIILIAERLHLRDIARLAAVCGSWSWALGRTRRNLPPPRLIRPSFVPINHSIPWLLLPRAKGEYPCFLDLSDPTNDHPISPFPEILGRRCVGSSPDGWIVTLDLSLNPRILNPLTREEFPLPSLLTVPNTPAGLLHNSDGSLFHYKINVDVYAEKFRDMYVRKIILTSAPPSGIAVAITVSVAGIDLSNGRLAFARVGDSSWAPGPYSKQHADCFNRMSDIIFCKEDRKFYAVSRDAAVVVLDLEDYNWESPSPPRFTILAKELYGFSNSDKSLVFLSGDLLQIRRNSYYTLLGKNRNNKYEYDHVVNVEVLKFDPHRQQTSDPPSCWISVFDLGDFSIFLGSNHSFSLNVADKPGLRRNSIYLTGLTKFGRLGRWYPHEAGVFDLRQKKFHRFFPIKFEVSWPLPVYFTPSVLRLTA